MMTKKEAMAILEANEPYETLSEIEETIDEVLNNPALIESSFTDDEVGIINKTLKKSKEPLVEKIEQLEFVKKHITVEDVKSYYSEQYGRQR